MLLACLLAVGTARPAGATWSSHLGIHKDLAEINRGLAGRVLDFTANHGADHRIYSAALGTKRDLYVYVPPGYDPRRAYPLVMYFHGIAQDEENFLAVVPFFDRAIACGRLPPTIVAVPDGSIAGRPSLTNAGSFYINSNAGRFEDYVTYDVWNFLVKNFPIRPEREAHALVGPSMGGFAAYNLGIKYRDRFKVVAGIFPPLNLRYLNCRGRYFAPFDPHCLGIRERLAPHAPVGRFAGGLITIRERHLIDPLYGRGPHALAHVARENPAEMLTAYDVRPGQLDMFVGYGDRDEFNLNAQVESFLYLAAKRGIAVTAWKALGGGHSFATGVRLFPYLADWLAPRLTPYAPGK